MRYQAAGDRAAVVDVLDRDAAFGREGPGTIHHVAVRVPDREALLEWHDRFRERGDDVSRAKDRHFFHSLYVREPGGILVELATEGRGGESAPSLDAAARPPSLYLPERFEADRALIESQLPRLRPPDARGETGDQADE